MTFELSETAMEHIHMPENLYQQREREEVGWGERERGSRWEEQKGRQTRMQRGKEGGRGGGGRGEDRGAVRAWTTDVRRWGGAGVRSVGTLHCTTHATQV